MVYPPLSEIRPAVNFSSLDLKSCFDDLLKLSGAQMNIESGNVYLLCRRERDQVRSTKDETPPQEQTTDINFYLSRYLMMV